MAGRLQQGIPPPGASVDVTFEALVVRCDVLDTEPHRGGIRVLVRPQAGTGRQWVALDRVTEARAHAVLVVPRG